VSSSATAKLDKHYGIIRAMRMVDLFDADPQRADYMSISLGPLYCDFSKNRIDDETLRLLVEWAQAQKLPSAIQALFAGRPLNTTEKRPALHTVLRQTGDAPCEVAGHDVVPNVRQVQQRMRDYVNATRASERYRHVINIGVGGSDLGPQMVCRALRGQADGHFDPHFISNMDAHPLSETLAQCDPAKTLVIITSKSFTTLETLHNADKLKAWLVDAVGEEVANQQLVAVTAKPELAEQYGVQTDQIFPFWDWVGGRYSMWSAVGLSIALVQGWAQFEQLLQGAAAMDEHFASAPLEANLPVVLALLGCWYRNWFDYSSHCMAPYEERLEFLVPYLKQLDMESNGKTVGRAGEPVGGKTGPIIWGQPGTNAQHAFFQWLHQGRDIAPVDFIASKTPEHDYLDSHRQLLANAIAQAEALLTGKQAPTGQPHRQFDGNRPSNFLLLDELNAYSLGMLIALYEHKVFVQGWMWGLNSFDQWGVELGKQLASTIDYELSSGQAASGHDCSTQSLINRISE
jgi:glucose-6-phosphate isomerase